MYLTIVFGKQSGFLSRKQPGRQPPLSYFFLCGTEANICFSVRKTDWITKHCHQLVQRPLLFWPPSLTLSLLRLQSMTICLSGSTQGTRSRDVQAVACSPTSFYKGNL